MSKRNSFLRLDITLSHVALGLALSAGVACYGSELDGVAPELPTTPDADTNDGDTVVPTDGTGTTDATDATDPGDGDATTNPDTEIDTGPPPMWETLSLGDQGAIGDVVAVRADLAYAVSGTRVLRWNGATWAAYGEPGGDKVLHGVWAAVPEDAEDPGEVVVVGAGGLVARRVDGADWQVVDVGTTLDLWDVDGRGPDDLYVVGAEAQVRHWDGTAWTERFTKDTLDLRAVWVDRTTTGDEGVFAVGTGGQLVSYEGAFKAAQIAGGAVVLSDIVRTPDATLVAVGTGHTITARRTTDVTWRGQATNDAAERDVHALALTDDGKLWAFGADGLVLQQSGTTWGTVGAAQAVAGLQDFAAAAVLPGEDGEVLVLAGDGGGIKGVGATWALFPTRPEAAVKDLEAGPDGTVWAAGTLGLLMSRGPDGWSVEPLPADIATANLEAVTVTPSGVVWAVGAGGTIVKKIDGSPATRVASPVPLDLFGVASNANGVVACGRGGTLIAIVGDADPTIRASGATADLRAAAYGGDGALWIAGAFGTLLRAEGDALPAPVLSGVGGALNDLTATTGGVLAVGDNGVVLFADADGAELLAETPGVFLQGVAASAAKRYAAGWNGTIVHEDGAEWVTEPTGTNLILEAIWLGADEALAAGRQGVLLRRLEAP